MTDSEFLEYLTAETQAVEDSNKQFIVAELKAKVVFWQAQCELREKRLKEVEAELAELRATTAAHVMIEAHAPKDGYGMKYGFVPRIEHGG